MASEKKPNAALYKNLAFVFPVFSFSESNVTLHRVAFPIGTVEPVSKWTCKSISTVPFFKAATTVPLSLILGKFDFLYRQPNCFVKRLMSTILMCNVLGADRFASISAALMPSMVTFSIGNVKSSISISLNPNSPHSSVLLKAGSVTFFSSCAITGIIWFLKNSVVILSKSCTDGKGGEAEDE